MTLKKSLNGKICKIGKTSLKTGLHLFDKKYSKKRNIVKYYYNSNNW